MITKVLKRDGRKVTFNTDKIAHSIFKAAQSVGGTDFEMSEILAEKVANYLDTLNLENNIPTSQNIQDTVEKILIENEHSSTAKAYIASRYERTKLRDKNSDIMKTIEKISKNNDIKNKLYTYGKETIKKYNLINILKPEYAKAHTNGDIYIHNLESFSLSSDSYQIDLVNFFNNSYISKNFNSIEDYSRLAINLIMQNQNNNYTNQSISNFDYAMAIGVQKTYRENHIRNLSKVIELLTNENNSCKIAIDIVELVEKKYNISPCLNNSNGYLEKERDELLNKFYLRTTDEIQNFTNKYTYIETKNSIYNAMKLFINNLKLINNPITINYGLNTSNEGREIMLTLLKVIEEEFNNKTNILPISILKIKDGINYNKEDVNYDILKLAINVAQETSSINFVFIDAPFNSTYYKENDYNTEISYSNNRTRIIENIYNNNNITTCNRENIATTTINLPRIALLSNHNIDTFFELLNEKIYLVANQLIDKLNILISNNNNENSLKQGTLSIGFIGLAECLIALIDKHHGESKEAQELGIKIITYMREKINILCTEYALNFTLIGTSCDSKISNNFVILDREKFGIINKVNDTDYYTDSFQVPNYTNINNFEKIKIEAPYHNLTNGGHMTNITLDSTEFNKLDKFEEIIRCMKESGIGYGNITKNSISKIQNNITNKNIIFDDIKLEPNITDNDIDVNIKINNLDTEIENIINSQLDNKF